ncbi:hypothetical protein K466DRAFT_636370 [Polyporus arcularius HHB13444]|uniref:Uncharacterized protein n=1 Tax=Polyporus arcularius HHB13444 TaxID=1314778 RepID=A0A5C3NTK6_9APHY|nr:hypothetical protein K466DRAFT_636370 [Polyporus arcularius HHB13444]
MVPNTPAKTLRVVVKQVGLGRGQNPSTFLMIEPTTEPIKSGVGIRMYTKDGYGYEELAWCRVMWMRTWERQEVEFVVQRIDGSGGLRGGERHLLVERRDVMGQSAGWTEPIRAIKFIWAWLGRNEPRLHEVPPKETRGKREDVQGDEEEPARPSSQFLDARMIVASLSGTRESDNSDAKWTDEEELQDLGMRSESMSSVADARSDETMARCEEIHETVGEGM